MIPELKPIETQYAGCRFRSRLEARWAVLFDHLGHPWRYEPEGFELPTGWYLPDFYCPAPTTDYPTVPCWSEIKGECPTEREAKLAQELADATDTTVYIHYGDIPRDIKNQNPLLAFYPGLEFGPLPIRPWCMGRSEESFNAACTAARSARFEHGESLGAA